MKNINKNIKKQSDHKTINRQMFNSIASTYDFLNHFLSLGTDVLWRKKTIKKLGIDSKHKILDLATGTGDLAKEALKRKPLLVIGVDPAFEMLKRTKKKIKNNFYAIEAFGEAIPIKENFFDRAMISYGIRNVSNRPAVFKEIYRVMKKNGKFAILEFSESKSFIFRGIYNFYFKYILTKLGGLISRNKRAYEYLPESVLAFVTPEKLAKECEEAGFNTELILPIFTGITTLIIVKKN
ncbi:MAG: bifunctional demethylmenaquinone methyltransferase/2-methoxy-6-polyprenyl-1,4-benzoquinol methylase UbiE [Spirochaetia bacterium]|nr:bifunctional demethylmenaquinone methyltransferase/2-methoxy-6-polyprenyl-1,4-benzoquinol methylase UbiE [Spirochaetia bacterium]